jgi:hypothetical protein
MLVRRPYLIAGCLFVAAAIALALLGSQPRRQPVVEPINFQGRLRVSDWPTSRGNYTCAADYETKLAVIGTSGHVTFTFSGGTCDLLEEKVIRLSGFNLTDTAITFSVGDRKVRLDLVVEDNVWNGAYDEHYIASRSWDEGELRGAISSTIFPGVEPDYYLELRVAPVHS